MPTTTSSTWEPPPCETDASAILNAIRSVVDGTIRKTGRPVQLHEPSFGGRERDYIVDAVDSTFVSSVGEYVNQLERDVARVCEVEHAVVTVNGTAALHVCLLLAGVRPGDEVLVPALTFVATANAVAYCGAIPHLCEATGRTLGLDPSALEAHLDRIAERTSTGCRNRETGRRIAAVMPMHTFGHPVEIDELLVLCERWGIILVEDAAEGLGSRYKGRHVGGFGLVSGLSFNGNKIITTGGGGAVLTNDAGIARKAKHITTTAKLGHKWAFNHDQLGYNYRMPNLNAALGCAQLEHLDTFLAKKRRLAMLYDAAFAGVAGAHVFRDQPWAESNYWLVTLLLDAEDAEGRDALLDLLHENGVMARPVWAGMHRQPMYAHCPRMAIPVVEELEKRIISLPSSPFIVDHHAG